MKQKLLLFLFTLISAMLFSQSEQKAFFDWSNNTGTQNFFYKNVSATDRDGYIYVAGATLTGNGTTDILITRYDAGGSLQWTQQYNGLANGTDFVSGIFIDDNKNVYITGTVSNDSTDIYQTDLIVIKYDNSGNQLWLSTFDGSGSIDVGKSIYVDASYNVYVTGATLNSSYNFDIAMVSFDNSGTYRWSSTYDYKFYDDIGYNISWNKGDLLVFGAVTNSANEYKLETLVIDCSDGHINANTTSTAVTTSSVDVVNDVAFDSQKNIYITGGYYVSGQGINYYTMKLDSNLVTQWTQTYNGTANLDDFAKGLDVDSLGNVYVTGYSTSSSQGKNYVTIKYNSGGTQQWAQTFNNSLNTDDEAFALVVDDSSNVYVTGSSMSDINNKDYYTIKYNSGGTKIWDIQTDAHHLNDVATNIAIDDDKNIVVTGQCETSPNVYEYRTEKYVQQEIITPTDFNNETPAQNFMYYPNKGQIVDTNLTIVSDVKFYTNNTFPSFYLKNTSQSYVFSKIDTLHRIDLNFNGCNESSKIYPLEQKQDGYLNYFLAHTDSGGVVGVFGNQRLITHNLYNNIDLMYSSNQNGIKYYFIVKPGGDIRDIQMEFTGASSFTLNGTTNALSVNSNIGSLTFDRPTVYQLSAVNATVAVTGWTPDWQTNGASNKYKFNDGAYTSSLTLVIEVDQGNALNTSSGALQNIKWSTYLGKSSLDMINRVKTDNNNNLFAIGQTYSSLFPLGTNVTVYQSSNAGSIDGFISKFNSIGELMWSTFVGGTKNDNLTDVAFHSNGDLYCVGNTNSNDLFTMSKAGADNDATFGGPVISSLDDLSGEGYIFQLTQSGMTNPWLRYYGGSKYDGLKACAMNSYNVFYITGYSYSTDIPIVYPTGSFHNANVNTGFWTANSDGIIASFNSSSAITWATYVGSTTSSNGSPDDKLNDIVIGEGFDGAPPDIYVTGYAVGNNYPILSPTGSSTYPINGTNLDAVVTRFTNTGAMVWSTYFGGNGEDIGYALAYGNSTLYITGSTYSSNFLPINSSNDYYQTYGGNGDAFLLKVNLSNVITNSTYLGGSNYDMGYDIVYHIPSSTAYVSGQTDGANFPISLNNPTNTYNQSYAGAIDNFLTALKDNRTSLLWSTYLGGSLDEFYYAIANGENHQSICIDGNSNLYLGGLTRTGETQTNPFPLDNGGGIPTYYQDKIDGVIDATITKFDLVPVNVVGVNEIVNSNNDVFVYPNPASHNLFIKLNTKTEKATFKILNTLGQIVHEGSINSNISSINIEKLSSGFYVIELYNNNSKFSAKFIKND